MKQLRFHIIILAVLAQLSPAAARRIRFSVDAGEFARQDCPVTLTLPSAKAVRANSSPMLVELTPTGRRFIPSQLVLSGDTAQVAFILDGETPARTRRHFQLRFSRAYRAHADMNVSDDSRSLTLSRLGQPVLAYNYTLADVPQGVSSLYRRSGYIHPAFTPSGFQLTCIQPADHRHHYGIWNPWTHLVYNGRLYDLWNLGDSLGTVRAAGIQSVFSGAVMSGFQARLSHIVFAPQGEQPVIDETWAVTAWNSLGGFLWDFESLLTPCAPLPVLLQEYRYAGFGFRANQSWTRDNTDLLTSEGNRRPDIDGTRARWIYVNGASPAGRSGLLIMACPSNYNSPEPLRIWNEEANGGRGDVFINFAPTKNTDWTLHPGHTYRLRYRLFAYDGEMTPQRAEQLWRDFANPPLIITEP